MAGNMCASVALFQVSGGISGGMGRMALYVVVVVVPSGGLSVIPCVMGVTLANSGQWLRCLLLLAEGGYGVYCRDILTSNFYVIHYLFICSYNLPSFSSVGARSADKYGPSHFVPLCGIILMASALVAACGTGVGS
jgi:hypothetical protein